MGGDVCVAAWIALYIPGRGSVASHWAEHLEEREITSVHTRSILNAFESGPGTLIYALWQRAESAHGAQCQVGSREQKGGGKSKREREGGREAGDETWSECNSAECETREAVENRYEQEGPQEKRKQIQITLLSYLRFEWLIVNDLPSSKLWSVSYCQQCILSCFVIVLCRTDVTQEQTGKNCPNTWSLTQF